jgi:hypothetical protein
MIDESKELQRPISSNNLLSYSVSCNDDKGEVKCLRRACPYLPVSARNVKNTRDVKSKSSDDRSSPDDVNAISKVADWFQQNFELNRQPPKMPFESTDASQEDKEQDSIHVKESSPLRRYHRSASLPTETDLQIMWKTGQSHTLSPPVKQRKPHSQSSSTGKVNAVPLPPPTSTSCDTPPSKLLLRKKSTPQHRSPQINQSISSIMKPPKYSIPSNNTKDELDSSMRRGRHRAQSMPPMGPLPDLFGKRQSMTAMSDTSYESLDGWLPKGVDFMSNAEVYFFKK